MVEGRTGIVMRWYVQDELNRKESEQDEVNVFEICLKIRPTHMRVWPTESNWDIHSLKYLTTVQLFNKSKRDTTSTWSRVNTCYATVNKSWSINGKTLLSLHWYIIWQTCHAIHNIHVSLYILIILLWTCFCMCLPGRSFLPSPLPPHAVLPSLSIFPWHDLLWTTRVHLWQNLNPCSSQQIMSWKRGEGRENSMGRKRGRKEGFAWEAHTDAGSSAAEPTSPI